MMMKNRLFIKTSDWRSVHYIITSDNGVQCAFAPQVHTDQRDVPIVTMIRKKNGLRTKGTLIKSLPGN